MQQKEGYFKLKVNNEMARIKRQGTVIKNEDDLSKVENESEREVARYFLDQGMQVIHEPFQIIIYNENGPLRSTIPDFEIFDPSNNKTIIVEVTTSDGNCPKGKQRSIVSQVYPFLEFRVLRRSELTDLQKRNPQYRFLSEHQALAA